MQEDSLKETEKETAVINDLSSEQEKEDIQTEKKQKALKDAGKKGETETHAASFTISSKTSRSLL